ncbi:uncharacterized protein LOC130945144 [Arachis stenosperma]|uniref:uncharacterized protein LOC130945144 n=1 Tax=Arachis stenosperma TaxID=217475 RepID=UPI0025ACFFE8|nr:uncharacterized protein LOC130945144 [Arachis stenosperma]
MMSLLEDSGNLEALTLNYFAINNLWTWLAVITAALSFWKIRVSANSPHLTDLHAVPQHPPHDHRDDPPSVPTLVFGDVDVDGPTKGKFTVYYEDDDDVARESHQELLTEWHGGCESEWWESWERLLKLRVGENQNGWYTWQDLTAINGNVVRLWDGEFPLKNRQHVHVW